MACSNCGQGALLREYTLRFTLGDQSPRELDIDLCTDCLTELCSEPEIELTGDVDPLPST